ncbi:MAG: hypothetical protein NXI00_18735 [Cytophagales bacterium]|nr:hypothetical protein [Cytophagales bacterium]
MSKFLEIKVKNHVILHGFDENNKEILEEVEADSFVTKLVAIDRIQSISEQYILTSYAFGRLIYWEYEGTMDELKSALH